MAKLRKDLNIHFKGKSGDLVIKLNGKIIFPYQEEQPKKPVNPNKLKTQLKTGVAAAFSGAVNRIPLLQETWKRWPVKSRTPYRNILAANMKRCNAEHPTTENLICPPSTERLTEILAQINTEGITVTIPPLSEMIELREKEKTITAVGVFSAFSPSKKKYESCSIYPLYSAVNKFAASEDLTITFVIRAPMAQNLSNYERGYLYFTILIGDSDGNTKRWFRNVVEEYLIQNDEDGNFKECVKVV